MDCSHVMAGIEMPGTTADSKGVMTKADRNPAQAILSDFKKKLESLTAAGQPAAVTLQTIIMPGQDHSMAINTAAQAVPQEVIGILEGFGLLDYQTDISGDSTEAGQLQPGTTENPESAAAQQAQISGEFARMLSNEQPGGAAQSAQPQTNADAEKYSGSLESTNSGSVAQTEGTMTQSQDAAMLLKSRLTAESRPQNADAQLVQSQPQHTATSETAGADTASANTGETNTAKTDTAQAAMTEKPGKDAGEQTPIGEKTEALTMTAEASPENTANAGQEPVKVSAQQTDALAETADPQKTTTDFVKDNVIRIVDKARVSISEGRYEFDVELKPEFLGKVSIKLTMENGEVRMHVHTEDAAVKGLFSDHSGSLQNALKEKGIVISTVDVSYQDPMAAGREAFGQQAGGNGQRREGQIGWSADRYSGSELFDTTVPVSELLGGSSVEYLA